MENGFVELLPVTIFWGMGGGGGLHSSLICIGMCHSFSVSFRTHPDHQKISELLH